MAGRPWVFQVSAQCRVGQSGAAVELVVFQLSEHPETLGVALEVEEVIALDFAHCVQPATACRLFEPVTDGVFTGVAEGWVANVVGQAGRLDDHAQIAGVAPVGQGAAQGFADPHTQ